ncbi:hypothetical protein Bca4012_036355 [Brassica carinata]
MGQLPKRTKPNKLLNIRSKKKNRYFTNDSGPSAQRGKTIEKKQTDTSPPRVRSPSNQWTRIRPRRNLLPPEEKRRYDGDSAGNGRDEKKSLIQKKRRLSVKATGNADHRNRDNPGEEPPSTPKKRAAETKPDVHRQRRRKPVEKIRNRLIEAGNKPAI